MMCRLTLRPTLLGADAHTHARTHPPRHPPTHPRRWDLHSYMALGVILAHEAAVTGMIVVPESGWLVSCSTDRTVRVWDYGAAQELHVWRHPEEFRCVALHRSMGQVLAGTEQHNVVSFPLHELVTKQGEDKERRRKAAEKMMQEAEAAAHCPGVFVDREGGGVEAAAAVSTAEGTPKW